MSIATYDRPELEFDLADRMRKALRVADISVNDMADYLDMSRNAVGSWINGRIVPGRATVRLFAMRCGVPYEWLAEVHPLGLEPRTHWLSVRPVGTRNRALRLAHRVVGAAPLELVS